MTVYDFLERQPKIGRVVVVAGTERILAERALAALIERLLEPAARELGLDRFRAEDLASLAPLEAALAALPFFGAQRVVVLRDAQALAAEARRKLVALAEGVAAGAVLVIEDHLSPASKRPQALGAQLGRAALRIDTTATPAVRERFVRETLAELDASAEPAALAALVRSGLELTALRTDLEKLALGSGPITLEDVLRESIAASDVRAFRFAGAVVAGEVAEALQMADEMFAADPRGAAIPLLSALASEYAAVWEAARPGGSVPARLRWRERELGAAARRLGLRRARLGFERALRGFEAIVTGRADDPRLVVELAAALAARRSAATLPTSSRR
ncbi:MAG: DNA polymerase III subunit delta [Vulcanimicrobiaceae bacterium]